MHSIYWFIYTRLIAVQFTLSTQATSSVLSPEPCPGGRCCMCGERKGSPAPAPLARAAVPFSHNLLPAAALPITQHSLRRTRSLSPAEAAQAMGVSNPSPSKVSGALLPQLPSCSRGVGTLTRTGVPGWSLLASHFLPAQLLPPRGAKRVPLVLLLSAGCRQQRGREVSCKFCSSCVLQSVSHADRTGRRSHTEVMP